MREASPTTVPGPTSRADAQGAGEPALHWIFPSVEGRIIPLPAGKLTLGRDPDNGIELASDQTSRKHAGIERCGAVLMVRDLGSRNGVFVNGTRVSQSPLAPGDLLRIGGWLGIVRWLAPSENRPSPFREVGPGYFVGPVLAPVLSAVERVAPQDLPVVIQGETGTGKEGIARALHALSRRPGPLVALNCAALPEALAEGELFGYRRGAFTGADRPNVGHLRAADHGTLFLDEIADLPLGLQAKLLRALEQHEVQPLGESTAVPVDLRVVVAAQSPLAEQVKTGRIRGDLFARLNGITLQLPPLRQRLVELPFLLDRMLRRAAKGTALPTLDPAAVEALCLYDWPFNLRELELTARQLWALHGQEPVLKRSHLPEHMRRSHAPPEPAQEISPPPRQPGPEPDLPALLAALRTTHGNVAKAAEILGISRPKVYRMMEKAEIDPEEIQRLRSGDGKTGDSD